MHRLGVTKKRPNISQLRKFKLGILVHYYLFHYFDVFMLLAEAALQEMP